MATKPLPEPQVSEVRIDRADAQALLAFLSSQHETLGHAYIAWDRLVATDGASLIELHPQDGSVGEMSHECTPKLLPGEHLALVRSKKEALYLDLQTGAVELRKDTRSPAYPIVLPSVGDTTETGQAYPPYQRLFRLAPEAAVTLGINPLFVARLTAIRNRGLVALAIPHNSEDGCVTQAVSAEIREGSARGLIMPERIVR